MPARLPKRSSKKMKGKGKAANLVIRPNETPIDYSNPPAEHKRSRLEREEEAFKILNTMIETGFTVTKYPCLQVLINHVYNYIHNSVRIELNIPLPEIDRTITGVLATDRREQVVVCLKAGVITPETTPYSETTTPAETIHHAVSPLPPSSPPTDDDTSVPESPIDPTI